MSESAEGVEKIIGPVHGFHLACYTVATSDGHFGYAKVCAQRPASVWETGEVFRKLAVGPYEDPQDALLAVLGKCQVRLMHASRAHSWRLARI